MTVEAAIEEIKRIGVKHGDIVVLKTMEEISMQARDDITRAIVGHLGLQVIVWFLLKDETIETLDEKEMNAVGWYRKP